MKKIHSEIEHRLQRLDFTRLYPGFHPFRFALYDEKKVCFENGEIPWDSRFVGNTAIDYNGAHIAIWNMKGAGTDMDVLTSKLVHEMLHAYQRESAAFVYPDEVVGAFYPRDLNNFALRCRENLLLADLAARFYADKWKEFLDRRAYRLRRYPEAAGYEIKVEDIEGTAQFAELGALRQLSPALYRGKMEKLLAGLREPAGVLDARRISYDTGAVIRAITAENGLARPDWDKMPDKCADFSAGEVPGLKEAFDGYFSGTDRKVKEIIAGGEELNLKGQRLLLFDPYNVRSSGAYLYHPDFIGIGTDEKKPELMTGAFVTKMAGRTLAIEGIWRARPAKPVAAAE